MNLNHQSMSYLTVLVGFINCLLTQPEDSRIRLNIRFEFINLRLNQALESLKKFSSLNDDLSIQIELFEKFQWDDFEQNDSKLDMNNLGDVFQAICMKNQFAEANEQKFLELLQILVHLEDENKGADDAKNKWFALTNAVREIIFFKGLIKYPEFKNVL